jgi:GH25 family lysozyme M1 (1,4-beta-N-acetylmuramidase)
MAYEVLGIDVSRYQASADGAQRFDWSKAKQRIYFAYLRASVGAAGVDFQLYYNLQECLRLGIPCGLYHYFKPDKDWKKQADLFASLAANEDKKPACKLPPVVDVEDDGGLSTSGLNKSALGGCLEKFVNRFEAATGLELMIYTSPGFWDASMPKTNWAKNRRLWVANYVLASKPVSAPKLPAEWTAINQPKAWEFWQWTCTGDGRLYGSMGDDDIDLNYYNGSLEDFNREYGLDLKPLGQQDPPALVRKVEVLTKGLNFRSSPVVNPATDAGDLQKGATLEVIADCGNWYQVSGYVWKKGVKALGTTGVG